MTPSPPPSPLSLLWRGEGGEGESIQFAFERKNQLEMTGIVGSETDLSR
jgi:hypothetical protein